MRSLKVCENRMVPDIRPENIETITESYTPSGGAEQNEKYKILNVFPILGGVLDKFSFFRTHAAAVWYNKLAGTTVKQKLDELNEKLTTRKYSIITDEYGNFSVTDIPKDYVIISAAVVSYKYGCFVNAYSLRFYRIDNTETPTRARDTDIGDVYVMLMKR